MERKLRKKFILISVAAVSIVLFIISAIINYICYQQIGATADSVIQMLISQSPLGLTSPGDNHPPNNKHFPPFPNHRDPKFFRYFSVWIDSTGSLVKMDTRHADYLTDGEAQEYVQQALNQKKTSGRIGSYKYAIQQQNNGGSWVIFVDISREDELFTSFLCNTLIIDLAGLVLFTLLVTIFSGKAVAPIVESYNKQKKFITDAGHELKTPITIINANTEILEIEMGQNEWLQSTHNQMERLSELVSSLITLSRMDELDDRLTHIDFSLSDAVVEAAEPFIPLAQSHSHTLELKITSGLSYTGDEKALRQLVGILLDNAIKYSINETPIYLELYQKGKRCYLSVTNSCHPLPSESLSNFFERFYRGEASRNSTLGGFGLGLSIAKSIVEKHRGSISAHSPDGHNLIITVKL